MMNARTLTKCLGAALVTFGVLAIVVSLTAGLVLGTAIAVASVSLLSRGSKAGHRK
jgi:uncharacterized membrane protein